MTNRSAGWHKHSLTWAAVWFVVFAGIAAGYLSGALAPLDQAAFRLVASLRSDGLTAALAAITHLGGPEGLIPVAILLMIGAYFRGIRIEAVLLLLTLGVGELLNETAKLLFDRSRPSGFNLIDLPGSASFPSGHAMVGGAFYLLLSLLIAKRCGGRPLAGWLSLPPLVLVVLISISRVYLGVHYASDVLGGLSFAAACCSLGAYAYEAAIRKWRTGSGKSVNLSGSNR
ncbi:phosphatase PAP2 family protein [Brevibacillus sp. SYP-B805]|uniref:phosphatase PAP2 family protein n=1 Tax=Brevibacillus sp. SYP-B805 TaxID=1578199 RepID=UPI0013EBB556|nr:phosphatase PAP2 family protein [Brevibacillus sp. SYP-B805]NGQ94778.1 phosphatase PAP2 family protein [Brevibacillus sp. SYP-B805]